ncbi:MAG: hypothetical protein ACLSAC_24265 [Enterocloster bolteae]
MQLYMEEIIFVSARVKRKRRNNFSSRWKLWWGKNTLSYQNIRMLLLM